MYSNTTDLSYTGRVKVSGKLEFEFRFGKKEKARSSDQAFRILIMADLAGQQARPVPLAGRPAIKVDIDNFGKLMAAVSPSLLLAPPEGSAEPLRLRFSRLDDMHPDSLYLGSSVFAALRQQREALQDPLRFEASAQALGISTKAAPAAGESNTETLNRLLGSTTTLSTSSTSAVVNQLVRDVVSAHVVSDNRGVRHSALKVFDARIAASMRQILHHPAFRKLESTWRGLSQLVSELGAGEDLEICVLDVSRAELEADLLDNDGKGLRTALAESIGEDGPWSLLATDFAFTADAADLCMLAALAWLAREHDAPLLAAAQPALVGCTAPEHLLQPSQWQALPAPISEAWQAFRQRPEAAWLGLAMPRLLGRLPYGKATDPISTFAFEEIEGTGRHEDFAWDNPVYALTRLVGEAFADDGWEMDPSGYLEIGPLPSYVFGDEDGEMRQKPCAEVMMTETTAKALLSHGIMPMLSYRNRDAARLLRWQSIAAPARPLAGVFSS